MSSGLDVTIGVGGTGISVGVGGGGISVGVGSIQSASAAIAALADMMVVPTTRRMAAVMLAGVSDVTAASTVTRMAQASIIGAIDSAASPMVNQVASAVFDGSSDVAASAMAFRMSQSAPAFTRVLFVSEASVHQIPAPQERTVQFDTAAFLGANMATRKKTRGAQYALHSEFQFAIADSMVNINGVLIPFNAASFIADVIPLPMNAVVIGGDVTVETASDDSGAATIAIGDSLNNARYMAATSIKAAGRTPLSPTGFRGNGEDIRMTLANAGGNAVNGLVSIRVSYMITGRIQENQIT
jgi:hypothetical protein